MLAWCSDIYLQNATVYETLSVAGVLKLPSASTLQRHLRTQPQAQSGHQAERYDEIGKLADELGLEGKEREVSICFDAVNVVGNFAFKMINGKHVFYGMVDPRDVQSLYRRRAPPRPLTAPIYRAPPAASSPTYRLPLRPEDAGKSAEETVKGMMASHVLVMQVTFAQDLSGKEKATESVVRRVSGFFAVQSECAERITEIFWRTVQELKERRLRVISCVCDGASGNRLFQKIGASPCPATATATALL